MQNYIIMYSKIALLVFIFAGCVSGNDGEDGDGSLIDLIGDEVFDKGVICGEGQTVCGNLCVNTRTDHENCGYCGHKCEPTEVCNDGMCLLECPGGRYECNGSCVDFSNDRDNCGRCGNRCPSDMVCNNGECDLDCSGGLVNCFGSCVDLMSSKENCGSCGVHCLSNEICVSGECGCVPDCFAAECGDDGCGGLCGNCERGMICSYERTCEFNEIIIYYHRTPVTSPSTPYRAGDISTLTIEVSPWSWIKDNIDIWTFKSITRDTVTGATVYDPDFYAAMSDILALGACDDRGHCVFGPDHWKVEQFYCGGINIANLRAREEWVEIHGFSSNHETFYFVCSDPD